MRVDYSEDGYNKSGSIISDIRKLWRLRSMPNLLELGRSHSRNLKRTVKRIRTSDDTVDFESELFTKFHEFVCGDYRGDIRLSYSITIHRDEIVGNTEAVFTESEGDFTVEVASDYDSEQELREFGRDILLLLLQYNIEVNSLYGETEHFDDKVVISGQGDLTVPVEITESEQNHHLVSEFPIEKPRALRILPF